MRRGSPVRCGLRRSARAEQRLCHRNRSPTLDCVLGGDPADSHRYARGMDQRRPRRRASRAVGWQRGSGPRATHARECSSVWPLCGLRPGALRPVSAAERIATILSSRPRAREHLRAARRRASRRAMIDVLKLRVLGPYHARLAISPREFRQPPGLARSRAAGRKPAPSRCPIPDSRRCRCIASRWRATDPAPRPLGRHRERVPTRAVQLRARVGAGRRAARRRRHRCGRVLGRHGTLFREPGRAAREGVHVRVRPGESRDPPRQPVSQPRPREPDRGRRARAVGCLGPDP